MDPDETLRQLRRAITAAEDSDEYPDVNRIAELFDALDEWIKSGGFLPRDWQASR